MAGTKGLIVTICAVLSTLALFALIGLSAVSWTERRAEPHYEYKVLAVQAEGLDRTGSDAMKFASVTPDDKELSKLGAEGWEVVGTYLEMQTAYPNFGDAQYVTGLQPNVRPQRAVIILRRRSH